MGCAPQTLVAESRRGFRFPQAGKLTRKGQTGHSTSMSCSPTRCPPQLVMNRQCACCQPIGTGKSAYISRSVSQDQSDGVI
jgi:hypothetical protein